MKYELIITEKPKAAEKIAKALANGKPIKNAKAGVPWYEITHGNRDIVVGCAVGHVFGLGEKHESKGVYPQFDVEWKPTNQINKGAAHVSKYITALRKLTKEADEFTVACDYDVEGEVIGYNVLRYICKQKDGNRMKFSTLTEGDLIEAYKNKSSTIDWGQANAGLTRHELDWYYGINLSRALMSAIKSVGKWHVMSSGRVQGPALKIIVDREKEIKAFIPDPYWMIRLLGNVKGGDMEAWHEGDKIWKEEEATKIFEKTKGQPAVVDDVTKKQFKQEPPVPFDLTTLQTESYRCFGIQPKETLSIAQSLYTEGLISYPRTSSQKLPKEIGYDTIIKALAAQEAFAPFTEKLLKLPALVPNEGKKTDPAHPAIYPTGEKKAVKDREAKVYSLIVHRFFAVFGTPATRETMTIKIDINGEIFIAKGTRTVEKNWHELYGPYVPFKEEELPAVEKGNDVKVKELEKLDKETTPPRRYTPASIIKELEKRGLGTKATRANILDNLFLRNYVTGKSIEATDLGTKTIETIETYCPDIVDEKLTREFEEEMDQIREKKTTPEKILENARKILVKLLTKFREHEKEIGANLVTAMQETWEHENTVGTCMVCGKGTLMIRKAKKGHGRFIGCSMYNDEKEPCTATYSLPATGIIKPARKECKECGYPLLTVIRGRSKRPQIICINPKCVTKKLDESVQEELKELEDGSLEKKCPKCGNNLVVRKSIYGKFLGCSTFPKCRHTEKIGDGPTKKDFKKKVTKKKTVKKKVAKKKVAKKK